MFRKWRRLFFYIKTIKKNIEKIRNHFILESQNRPYDIIDMKLDRVYRIYTVINLKPETQENLRKYGYYYLDNEVKKFITELNEQLTKIGLFEYVGLTRADQVGPGNVLIVVEYKFKKTIKIARNLLIFLLFLLSPLLLLLF